MSESEPINPINLGRGKRKKVAKKLFSSFSNYDGNESPVASTDGSIHTKINVFNFYTQKLNFSTDIS